jgi:exosortase
MTRSVIQFWSAMLLAPVPLLYIYYLSLWQIEQYRYFPVLFLAIGLLFWERWDRQLRGPHGWLSVAGLSTGVFAFLVAIAFWSPWIANLGWLLICLIFLRSQRSSSGSLESLVTIWPPMLLLVRLPLNLDQRLTSSLQALTSRISSHVLDRLEVTHTRTGNIFDMSGGRLFVEDACSGVQSLFSLLFIAFFLVAWMRRSSILLPIYALVGIFWAAVMNVVRVVVIALAQEWYALDFAHGWKHELLGYACLALAGLMLFSTDRFLRVWFYPLPSDVMVSATFNPLAALWNWFFDPLTRKVIGNKSDNSSLSFLPVLALSISTILIGAQFAFRPASVAASPTVVAKDLLWEPGADVFGVKVGSGNVVGFESVRGGNNIELGFNSDIWNLDIDGVRARVAVSQPYNEFHELCVCYEANGWKQNDRTIVSDSGSNWAYVTARFVAPDGRYGSLVFSGLSVHGEPINPTDVSLSNLFSARVRQTSSTYSNLMVQIWATSGTPFSPDQVAALVKSHLEAREIVRSRLVGQ